MFLRNHIQQNSSKFINPNEKEFSHHTRHHSSRQLISSLWALFYLFSSSQECQNEKSTKCRIKLMNAQDCWPPVHCFGQRSRSLWPHKICFCHISILFKNSFKVLSTYMGLDRHWFKLINWPQRHTTTRQEIWFTMWLHVGYPLICMKEGIQCSLYIIV